VRIARFARGDDVAYGVIGEARGDGAAPTGAAEGGADAAAELGMVPGTVIAELRGHPFVGTGSVQFTGVTYPLADVRLLAPVLPSKVVAVGKNYADHAREMGSEPPPEPVLFLKPSTAVVGPGEPIAYPVKLTQRVDYEGELAVIIGRLCREVPAAQAADVIFGYACANDVTARDLQARDGQWDRAKGFDTFCPLGPWIETDVDPADLALTTTVNSELRQSARTSQLLHDVPALVEFISTVMTLLPGDVLLTGTPAGVGPIEDGDEVSVSIEGIGSLVNRVVNRD
jgi:2-keto-4-pentenoate hydratase/2-oxohepta-3-ene-1,7-dioic acid hydratase in catechol pathway